MIIRRNAAAIVSFTALMAVVMFWTGPGLDQASFSADGQGEGTQQLVYLAIFAAVLAASGTLRNPTYALVLPLNVMAVLALCWLSVTWAVEPGTAFRRVALTTILMWTIFSAVRIIGYKGARDTLRVILAAALVINFCAVAVYPKAVHEFSTVGAMQLIGDWRGMFPHKNHAGAACAVTVLLFWFDAKDINRWIRLFVLVGAAIFLIKTDSKTSMGLLIPALAMGMLYQRYDYRHKIVVAVFVVTMVLALTLLALIYSDSLAHLFSDEDAFTGRTQIWPVLLDYARDHWLLGSGYGSFWNISSGSPIDAYLMKSSWIHILANGHNGYLDILVQLGIPGLLLVILCLVVVPLARLLWLRYEPKAPASLVFALLIFCFGHNFTESSLLDRDTGMQVFFVIALAFLEACSRGRRAPTTTEIAGQDSHGRPIEYLRAQ